LPSASTRAVWFSSRILSGRAFHFLGSFTFDIGLTRDSSMISHSCALVKIPLMMLRRSAIMYQESQTSLSQSSTSLARKRLMRMSRQRGRMWFSR
jgi:hypothetical protein